MKKRILSVLMSLCILITTIIFPSSEGYAVNNDARYDFYKNMDTSDSGHAKYIVPNLYRQDASYSNFKNFPLVITDGEEYVPLDIFAMFSYIKVVYSKLTDGFYINNVKNNHYVAFDMGSGTTTTHDTQMVSIEAIICYRTYYVPALEVCSILGLNFESYDDFENGIRAVRISDNKAKLTIEELVKMYSPTKKESEDSSDNTAAEEKNDTTVAKPNQGNSVTNNDNNEKDNDSEKTPPENGTDKNSENNVNDDTKKPSEDNRQPYNPSDSVNSEYQTKPLNNKPSVSNTDKNKPADKTETPPASSNTTTDNSNQGKPATSGNAVSSNDSSATSTPPKSDTSKPAVSENKPAVNPSQTGIPSTPAVTTQPQTPVQQKPQTPVVNVPPAQTKPQPPAKPDVSEKPTNTIVPPVGTNIGDGNVQTPVQEVDPMTKVADRKIHITFNVTDVSNLDGILDVLSDNHLYAVVFATAEQILAAPDAIRRIIADGHSAGILFDAVYDADGELDRNAVIEEINNANDMLYMVSKTKTRYIRANYDNAGKLSKALKKSEFSDYAENNGFELFDWDISSGEVGRYKTAQFDSLKNLIVGTNTRSEKKLFVKFNTENGTSRLLQELVAFTAKYPQFDFRITDEYTQKVSFIGN